MKSSLNIYESYLHCMRPGIKQLTPQISWAYSEIPGDLRSGLGKKGER